ncbi:TetR/AcrR family transcriptional regulator C-terminal domain-containing protein [Mycobacterium sp. pUA109]|uniref:TetR/AcrR family transcriptional regulator C-terminal domain-containing protein n=1 Tax=Mycobacterium sp. pUA109 TaxID=3238982 RepID=UPI00351B97D4
MSLYRHIATQQELLRAVPDTYLTDVQFPVVDELSWDETIKRVILVLDEEFESHPRLADIMSVQPIEAAAVLAALELCASALRRGGLGDDEVVSGLAVLTAYATGYVRRRAERRRNAAVQEERLARIRHLDEVEFPTLASLGDAVTALGTHQYFEAGLDILIDALSRRAAGPSA